MLEYQKLREALLQGAYTDAQFKEVKAISDIRLGNFSAQESASREVNPEITSDTYAILFLGILANVLKLEADINLLPYSKLKSIQPKVHKQVVEVAYELFKISEQWNPDKARSRNFAIGVFHLYCKLVVAYLQKCHVPVSLKTCLQHVDKFPGMVDDAFPGYVKSGAIHMVIMRRNEN